MSDTKTMACKNCKHFAPEAQQHGFSRCSRIEHMYDVMGWDENYDNFELVPDHKNDLAVTSDGSAYASNLWVRPDFFCAHFSAPN